MNEKTKAYTDSLSAEDIPWHRMFTAYGTANGYSEILHALEQTDDAAKWKSEFAGILSDFEHQSTMFPPAPFVLVFLTRILERCITENTQAGGEIAQELLKGFIYYAQVCDYAEKTPHAPPLDNFSDMLNEAFLLPEEFDEARLEEIFEDPDAVPDELFYSFYHYSKEVLSQVPDILDKSGRYPEESAELKKLLGQAQ